MMQDDSMRSIFLNNMGGDIAQWDTFKQEYGELASAYQALGGTPPQGYLMKLVSKISSKNLLSQPADFRIPL